MKNLRLRPTVLIIFTLIIATSCVSKRKYLETDSARMKALERIGELTQNVAALKGNIADLKKEFNTMQNEFRHANARKDSYIDSLSKKALGLSKVISIKDESLNDQSSVYQSEKLRLNSTLAQYQATISELTGKAELQANEILKLKQESISLKFDIDNQKEETASKTNAMQAMEGQQKKFQSEIDKYKKEITSLKNQISTQNKEIEKLNNIVKLLKKQ